jgi:ATP-dependent Clp protease ATP-binding subunit ClpA
VRPDEVNGVYSHHGPGLDLNHLADDAHFTVEVHSVVASARRRATRDGDRQVDTAHLLHSLLENDPRAYAACDAGGGQSARMLGYLVQRSIGYGLRWHGSVEDSGELPTIGEGAAPGWSPSAAAAMRAAVVLARRGGRLRADGVDLLHALAADPQCRAMDVFRAAGIDVDTFRDGAASHRDDSGYRDDGPVAS